MPMIQPNTNHMLTFVYSTTTMVVVTEVVIVPIELAEELRNIGFTEYEAKIYIALVKRSPLTGSEVARLSGVPSAKVYATLEKLTQRNLVSTIFGDSVRYVAINPDELIERYKFSMVSTLEKVRDGLMSLQDGGDSDRFLWNIQEYEVFMQKAKTLIQESQEDIRAILWSHEYQTFADDLSKAAKRGVHIHVITDTKEMISGIHTYHHVSLFAQGSVPRPMIVVRDEKEVLIGLNEQECQAIWSTNPVLKEIALTHMRHEIAIHQLSGSIGENSIRQHILEAEGAE
ncbi:hypothetical protein LSG31_17375 [Fodinisporobacter ferrooxydans]|uniref:TrmB family transcriptional regulator n=1 Tax=Fodinisporobacter ferrooxydans TaxID=2901836 RepID=A0ABY4CGJ3_9BACL|nr:hypothetical protein LSG31_17375 [Alicyclobacillaceae bacterium MYW30-H2]